MSSELLGMIAIGVALLVALPFALKFAGAADQVDAVFERAKELGFTRDPNGAGTIVSQFPQLGAPQLMQKKRNSFGPNGFTTRRRGGVERFDPENEVEITVLRRDTFEQTTLLFLAQKWMRDASGTMEGRMKFDRLLFALNPKNSAVVPAVDPARLAGSGWNAEAHGGWLLLYRLQPHTEWAATLDVTLQEASDLASALLEAR